MPHQEGETFPTAGHVVKYLHDYEQRYELPVRRHIQVSGVRANDRGLNIETDHGNWHTAFVISATGTWDTPFVPAYPGIAEFTGEQLHTVDYSSPERFRGRRVLIVGGGNSAAQIVAEVSMVAETTWATLRPPRFMPDDVDGRVLFDVATKREVARKTGASAAGVSGLGDIVMVPSVRAARNRRSGQYGIQPESATAGCCGSRFRRSRCSPPRVAHRSIARRIHRYPIPPRTLEWRLRPHRQDIRPGRDNPPCAQSAHRAPG